MGRRAWLEAVLAAVAALVGVATVAQPRWIEALFEASPDAGSGALESIVALALIVLSVSLSLLAWRDARRHRAALTDRH